MLARGWPIPAPISWKPDTYYYAEMGLVTPFKEPGFGDAFTFERVSSRC